MAAAEENSSLFLIFILTMIALPLVPYTITRLCHAATKKAKPIHCRCSGCHRSGKYRKSIYKKVGATRLFFYLLPSLFNSRILVPIALWFCSDCPADIQLLHVE